MPEPTINEKLDPIIDYLVRNGVRMSDTLATIREKYVAAALLAAGGNVTQASRKLGVHRNTIHNDLRKLAEKLSPRRKPTGGKVARRPQRRGWVRG